MVRRGFDTDEVRSYLQSVARSLETLEAREEELRAALAEAEERAAHPVVDEATLTTSLGQHSAQILRHAHEEAARIVVQAQEGAATLLRETQSQVDELQARTEASAAERVVEVELLVANAEQEARVESERIVAEAIAAGEAIITRAKDEGRALLDQVQEARRRVLSDLAARRRGLGIQIEQLRAARDEMAASVHGVRDRVDGILAHLDRTDEEARAAAQGVADQFRLGTAEIPHDQDEPDETAGEVPPTGPNPVVGGASGSEAGEDAAAPSVDELFARIRAGTAETQGPAPEAKPAAPAASEDAPGRGADRAEPAKADAGGGPDADAATAEVVADAIEDDSPEDPETEQAVAPGPDAFIISRRDELLTPITARLSRAIKRTLGDDQNRLLDRLRSAPALEIDELMGPEDEHVAAFAAGGAQPPRRGVRRRDDLRRSRRGDHPEGRCRGAIVRRVGARHGDQSAAAGGGGDRRPGRPHRRRLPGMEGRARGAAGRRSGHAGVLGGGGRGQRGRQSALGRHDRERVLGLRGQRAGRRGERFRGVPHRARAPPGPFGLPLPHYPGDATDQDFWPPKLPLPGPWGRCGGR